MTDHVDVTFYVQIEPEWGVARGDEHPPVRSASAVNMTKRRPTGTQKQGTIMAPITMRIHKTAFMPLSPKIVVTIPDHLISAVPIEVEAGDGTEDPDETA